MKSRAKKTVPTGAPRPSKPIVDPHDHGPIVQAEHEPTVKRRRRARRP